MIVDKIAFLTTAEAIRMMEEKIKEITVQIETLEGSKTQKDKEDINMKVVMEVVEYFLEHKVIGFLHLSFYC